MFLFLAESTVHTKALWNCRPAAFAILAEHHEPISSDGPRSGPTIHSSRDRDRGEHRGHIDSEKLDDRRQDCL